VTGEPTEPTEGIRRFYCYLLTDVYNTPSHRHYSSISFVLSLLFPASVTSLSLRPSSFTGLSLPLFLSRYSASSSYPSTQDPGVTQDGNSPSPNPAIQQRLQSTVQPPCKQHFDTDDTVNDRSRRMMKTSNPP